MKKQILLVAIVLSLLSSCSLETETSNFYIDIMPIESVNIPTEFESGQSYDIEVTYYRTSTCHVFNNFLLLRSNEHNS